jgi:hypothetical protein
MWSKYQQFRTTKIINLFHVLFNRIDSKNSQISYTKFILLMIINLDFLLLEVCWDCLNNSITCCTSLFFQNISDSFLEHLFCTVFQVGNLRPYKLITESKFICENYHEVQIMNINIIIYTQNIYWRNSDQTDVEGPKHK